MRRALGVSPIERVSPHITLVPPINVVDDDVDAAIALVRRVASQEPSTLHAVIGPVATFHPITPVVYLRVAGPGVEAIHHMRDALDDGPLAQELSHEFVPHVTLNDLATPEQIDGALASMKDYIEAVPLDGLTVLEQDDDKVWRPIADARFGDAPVTRTIGAERVTIAVHLHQTTAGAAIGRYRPLVAEAFVDGRSVGVARGRVAAGDAAWLDELVVIAEQRGTGVGGALARAFVEAARARDASELRAARGATVAGFLVSLGFAPTDTTDFVLNL